MPQSSTITITVGGVNVTNNVLYSSATFESQRNAIPGTFEFTVKDVGHTYSFTEGDEVALTVDGTKLYGGYVMSIGRSYPFAAMDTTTIAPVNIARYWVLSGIDYNELFSKRVLRNPANYLKQIPRFTREKLDGFLIRKMCADYLDVSEINSTTYVDDIRPPFNTTPNAAKKGRWLQQGSLWREQMEDFAQFTGALWYIDPDKYLHYHAIEDTVMRWGFSDTPNNNAVTASPATFQGATIGPREIDATEGITLMVNDAFIWGGSQLTQGVVFARATNSSSITAHGRWQAAETHFGEEGYKEQDGVDVRADIIVNGSPGAVGADQNRGLSYPQWNIRFAWFAHDVPVVSGSRDHVRPGYLSTISLSVFGGASPLIQTLPLRSVTITFPSKDGDPGGSYVRFDGLFGLQPDDPFSLWRYLLKNKKKIKETVVSTVTAADDATVYGAWYQGSFVETPDSSRTAFTLPFGYVPGTPQVYFDGLLKNNYTETDPVAGEITFSAAIPTGTVVVVIMQTLSS